MKNDPRAMPRHPPPDTTSLTTLSVYSCSMYCIILLDAAITFLTKLCQPPLLPPPFMGFYELSALSVIGFQMSHHTHGNPLFSGERVILSISSSPSSSLMDELMY